MIIFTIIEITKTITAAFQYPKVEGLIKLLIAFLEISNPRIPANIAINNPAIGSALLCPKGCSASAF